MAAASWKYQKSCCYGFPNTHTNEDIFFSIFLLKYLICGSKLYQLYYGYKDHVKDDSASKLITKSKVTDASVHDSQTLKDLLYETDMGKNRAC
jgi:hypothetical protein